MTALEAVLEAIGPAATAMRARLLASLASELHFAPGDRRVELGREALDIARTAGDPVTLAHVLGAAWFATLGLADLDERVALADELSELAGRLSDRSIQFEAAVGSCTTSCRPTARR